MRNMNEIPLSLLWVILSLLAVTENGETLLSDPLLYDDMGSSSSNLEGATAEARAGGCHFKSSFEGSWFQSGIHHAITIKRDFISKKGHCVEKEGEKYLVYSRVDKCYRCLVFNEKHLNVIQYKETFCIPEKQSLREICSTITGDANLYAMFRLDAVPIDCPFNGQFAVTYSRGQGECRHPPSSMESCTKSSRLVFNYQACPDVVGTESSVEEVQCVASWKEGSSRYFLGLTSYQHHASYEDRFRCFVYERSKHGHGASVHNSHSLTKFHSSGAHSPANLVNSSMSSSPGAEQIYRVAQSGDATCQGIQSGVSSMEGSRTMTLRKVAVVKPCQFPSWVQEHSHWHRLDQGSTYSFLSGNMRVSNFSELAGTTPNSLTMNANCYQVLEQDEQPFDATNVLILHATSECKTGYVCTAFYQRDENIMEVQFGSIVRRAEDACHVSHFNQTSLPYVTLVSTTPQRIRCPNVGHFQISGLAWNGRKITAESCRGNQENEDENDIQPPSQDDNGKQLENSLSVGCSSSDSMQIRAKSPCDNMDVVAEYRCYGWWSDGKGITYVVTTRSSSHSSSRPQRHCFAFRDLRPPFLLVGGGKKERVVGSLEDFISSDDDDHYDGQRSPTTNNNNGRLLEFSSFADSCRRNVPIGLKGDFAFNLTRIGQCSDFNSAPGGTHHIPIIILMLFTITTRAMYFVNV